MSPSPNAGGNIEATKPELQDRISGNFRGKKSSGYA